VHLLFACVLFASWLVLLLTGLALGGATHLLLVAALALYLRRGEGAGSPG
jgi:hypothetical protein